MQVFLVLAASAALLASPLSAQTNQVVFKSNTRIAAGDLRHDGKNIVVDGATVTIDGRHTFRSVSVINKGAVTHTANSTRGLHLVVQQDLTIAVDSAIHADGRGYRVGQGPGHGYVHGGLANGTGGGHGGNGVGGPFALGGLSYGNIEEPTDMGSGGGNAGRSPTGAGGGVVRLEVSGKLSVAGRVSANGANSDNNGGPLVARNGGGAGGSIWITTNALDVSGRIGADGGISIVDSGGGGRVAVHYKTSKVSGNITAYGGRFNSSKTAGGAGSVLMRNLTTNKDTLIFDNNNQASTWSDVGPVLMTKGDVIVRNGARITYPMATWGLYGTVMGDLTVGKGSSIEAVARGFAPVEGPDIVGVGTSGPVGRGGGSHIGRGGSGMFAPRGTRAGRPFGGVTTPQLPGGGGVVFGGVRSWGGGVLVLLVGGDLNVDGALNVEGYKGSANSSGAGGSILASAKRLVGAGLITAAGGRNPHVHHGGGGGGAVAVYSPDVTKFTGTVNVAGGPFGTAGRYTVFKTAMPRLFVPSYGASYIDNLDGLNAGKPTTAPNRASWSSTSGLNFGVVGAWGLPPIYGNPIYAGELFGSPNMISLVDSKGIGTGRTGLAMNFTAAAGRRAYACRLLRDRLIMRPNQVVRFEVDGFLPKTGAYGAVFGIGGGSTGRAMGGGTTRTAWPDLDCGPYIIYWADGTLRGLYFDNGFEWAVLGRVPVGAWHRVRVDYNLNSQRYDVSVAANGGAFQRTATSARSRWAVTFVDRYVVGTLTGSSTPAQGYLDNFSMEEMGTLTTEEFGEGVSGATGVPKLATSVVNGQPTLNIGNSQNGTASGWLVVGTQPTAARLFRGTLHVLPQLLIPITVPAGGTSIAPGVDLLQPYGTTYYAQVFLADPKAKGKVAISRGFEARWGR